MSFRLACLGALLLAGGFPAFVRGQEEAVADDATDPLVAKVELAADRYPLRWKDEATPLKRHTVLKWKNNPRGQEGIAIYVLWTRAGIPAAQASIYPWQGQLVHEFASLSAAETISASDDGVPIWSPRLEGVTYADVPGAPVPAASPVARLRQMKSIAEEFDVTMTGWKSDDSDREELRFLPRELYRYDEQELSDSRSGVVDGAVFAFAQGTDPEAILLLQAVGGEKESRWQYAFARATSGGLEARHGGAVVWTAPKNYSLNDPAAAQFSRGELIVE